MANVELTDPSVPVATTTTGLVLYGAQGNITKQVPASLLGGGGGGAAILDVSVKDSGALGNGAATDGPAVVTAVSGLKSAASSFGASKALAFPLGHYLMGSSTLDFTHTLKIEGNSFGQVGGIGTNLEWQSATVGLRFQAATTSGDRQIVAAHGSADASKVQGLFIKGSIGGATNKHAIDCMVRVAVTDTTVFNWSGNGINLSATAGGGAGFEGNANCFYVGRSAFYGCENGVYTFGADANAGVVIGVDASGNRAYGFNDESFLGNTYVGCHAANNVLGGYRTTNVNAGTVLVGCYDEGGQPPPSLSANTLVLGGSWGSGIETGVFVRAATDGNLRVQPVGGAIEVRTLPETPADLNLNSNNNFSRVRFLTGNTYKGSIAYVGTGLWYDTAAGQKHVFHTGNFATPVAEISEAGLKIGTGDTIKGIVTLTQAAYDALGTKDANTLYLITA